MRSDPIGYAGGFGNLQRVALQRRDYRLGYEIIVRVSLAGIERYVKGSLEFRQELWLCFTATIRHILESSPEITPKMKRAKDVKFVVEVLARHETRAP
jgi:hypothetical protein